MTYDTVPCDGCDNEIVIEEPVGPRPEQITFNVPTDDDQYELRDYELCDRCIREIIKFIEGVDERDAPEVDLSGLHPTVRGIRRVASDLDDLADDLDEVRTNDE